MAAMCRSLFRAGTRARRLPSAHLSRYMCSKTDHIVRAACCIIGDEILTGKVTDVNTRTLAELCFSWGIDLCRVEVITDEVEDIRDTIRRLSALVGPNGLVFTSGGIGPTHDDRTYEGVAAAFGRGLEVHDETRQRMLTFYAEKGQEMNDARLRMATLPKDSKVLSTDGLWVPLCVTENVYVLPGIPRLFEQMLRGNSTHFSHASARAGAEKKNRVVLATAALEGDIAELLGHVQASFPSVAVGSYPKVVEAPAEKDGGKQRSSSRFG